MRRSPLRRIAAACIVVVGFCFVAGMVALSAESIDLSASDFIEYWTAEQLIVHGGNPYSSAATLQMERAAGRDTAFPEISFSPPVALVFGLPLGHVSLKTGFILWRLALLASLMTSIWVLWLMHGCPNTLLHLLCFLFAPAVACLHAGQLGIFFLLGVVLFFYLHKAWPALAGAALLPCALKPHLFVPFAVALILWAIWGKTYRVLAGFMIALAISCALTLRLDSQLWSQYAQMVRAMSVISVVSPSLSAYFRLLIDRDAAWVQFVPEIAACGWAAWYFWTRRARWEWNDHGLLVLTISILCRPYGYFMDESVLLPAVLAGFYRARTTGRSPVPLAVFGIGALIELSLRVPVTTPYYLWTAPAWLAWYLYATRDSVASAEETRGAASLAD